MKHFSRCFPAERAAFVASVAGLPSTDCDRYVSSLLSRLMFLHFLGEQGPLLGDGGDDFYHRTLLPLLHSRPGLTPHPLELMCPTIRIPDEAFERLFAFFANYAWAPDEGSPRAGEALTPDVLGSVFEQHADRQRTGTYYTAPDVAAYIARGTFLPFLLDEAAARCPDAFTPNGLVQRLLRAGPDRYLFESVRRGTTLPLTPEATSGVNWDRAAPLEYALPAETWREYLARRDRCCAIRRRLVGEAVTAINDLLTSNLDLVRFALDLLRRGDVALTRAFWQALRTLSVLDPACGSGEFLLAALRVLEPLYDACLGRMEAFPEVAEFRAVLEATPARRACIRRSILERNLHGVDLMPEAVEVCRLRLLLVLVAAPSGTASLPNLTANLRCGNSLVGSVASGSESEPGATGSFHWSAEFPQVMGRDGFDAIVGNPPYLENRAVQGQYSVRGFRSEQCGNLFAPFWERCLDLARPSGRVGLIVPVAAVCTDDYAPLQELLRASGTSVVSSFNDRPSRLFHGLQHGRLCIILHEKGHQPGRTFSTGFSKWRAVERPHLFERLSFVETTGLNVGGAMAKVGTALEASLLEKVRRERGALRDRVVAEGGFSLYYTRKLSHFVQVLDFVPGIRDEHDRERQPSELRVLRFATQRERDVFLAILNANLFYWLLTVYSDCRNLNKREVEGMPFDIKRASNETLTRLSDLSRSLMEDIRGNARVLPMRYPGRGTLRIQCTYPRLSKPLIDDIDRALALHYGFTAEELEFLIHFDVKYRIGTAQARQPLAAGAAPVVGCGEGGCDD